MFHKRSFPMQRTMGVHIRELEKRLDTFNTQIMEESDVQRRNELDTELRAVESALKFYHDALETEQRLLQIEKSTRRA